MELNRNAEVALHGQAADIEWTLDLDKGKWELFVTETIPTNEPLTWKKSFNSDSISKRAIFSANLVMG